MNNNHAGGMSLPVPPIPVLTASSSQNSRRSSHSSSTHSRRSLKSLDRLLGDDRDPKKLQSLVHKLYEQLKFEKDRADYADRRASEAVSYLKSICEEKLRALRDISRLEEELKLYKIQYDEAQKEIFRAQAVLDEVDEKRFRAEKEAAEARSNARKMRDEINVMRAQEEGRREGLQEGFRKGREMGYQEGLQMAQAEMERMARPHATSQGSAEVERPASRMRTMNPITEPQTHQHQHSRVPSNAPSRPPTAPPETPTSPIAPQRPGVTSHAMAEVLEEPEVIRPRSFRGPSPSPRPSNSVIPPDNYIPHLGEDNRIHLPPPFELSRPPPTPERVQSPALQGFAENEEPRMIPPISTNVRMTHPRRSTSPGSASTTVSQMGMLADPYYDTGTPMSAIPEVPSPEASPETQDAANLRRQPSLGAQSVKLMNSGPNEHIYTRPRTTSGGSSISFQPPPVIPETDLRASMSSASTAPGITIQAPSAPTSSATEVPFNFPRTSAIYGNPNTSDLSFLPPIPEASSQSVNPVPLPPGPASTSPRTHHQQDMNSPMVMPGQMPIASGWHLEPENTSADSMLRNPPVIPHPDLYTNDGEDYEDEEEAMSSGMESMDSLTTPPAKQQRLPSRAASVRSAGGSALSHRTGGAGGSVAGGSIHRPNTTAGGPRAGGSQVGSVMGPGSAVGTISDDHWEAVRRSAFQIPIGFPPGPLGPLGPASAKTTSSKGKGRTPSMSTSRSGQ